MTPERAQPVFVPPGEGTALEFLAVTHKLTSAQTGGAYYLFESTFDAGDANRLHVHRDADEVGYVLEGALEVRLGGETRVLGAGGVARLPMRIPHALRNPLEVPSRYLFLAIPAGLDQWFDEIARARDEGLLDDATHRELSHRYGIDWLE